MHIKSAQTQSASGRRFCSEMGYAGVASMAYVLPAVIWV